MRDRKHAGAIGRASVPAAGLVGLLAAIVSGVYRVDDRELAPDPFAGASVPPAGGQAGSQAELEWIGRAPDALQERAR